MVDVPSARAHGIDRLTLHEDALRAVLNSSPVEQLLASQARAVAQHAEQHVRGSVSADDADNYVGAMFVEATDSDALGFDFNGPYELGNRPAATVGVLPGRGPNPKAMPPLMVEARTHALTSMPGFEAGANGEDIR